ncbi:bifunctional (p)ppGpp synthetase/guanosine-3',5'-bis(diphosphate) 3'-pyrophosphohydrolase [Chitinophaga agrisoli]|uniref:Bifunctional (P)ppGpp synthetase/guanosine-3',5'-bis(Diphosphate) 3'-pyrophosphohydrolase n=1 Tax=Chitinophaga agrisoli TaxID=2607653 RepID=A0A5B2VYK4_9BACT|nr:HD domain-containing protein [Chitinophaga agrisoli]KAA2243109.1 bifunctional (p)ppGpp synthetase/guanosine-3',5'-bis(diphosphate) 3'-pyrophosphohydrolase [Chitinophaga agrisoli]
METILEQIRDFADQAHGAQTRKYTPDRYIVHPVRVMQMCREYTSDVTMLAAALLHDVLEDTPVTAQALYQFLLTMMDETQAGRTLQLVLDLTDIYTKKNYPRWSRPQRKKQEAKRLATALPDAQTIKYADIMDNCAEIVIQDRDFAGTFLRECKLILDQMEEGNPVLRGKAIVLVNAALAQL